MIPTKIISSRLNLFLAVFAITMMLFMQSCADDNVQNPIDNRLAQVIEQASEGKGLAFFQQPDSDDFSKIPQDPRNPLTKAKVDLGQMLFHETGLAVNPTREEGRNTYSCSSCHHAAGGFQACKPQGFSEGGEGFGLRGEGRAKKAEYAEIEMDVQPVRTPSAMNNAYQSVTLWNGQFGAGELNAGTESEWTADTPKETNHLGYLGVETQAIAGLKVHRMMMDEELATELGYKSLFDRAFNDFPQAERYTFETTGLAIAAYERTILANQSPFQKWLKGDNNAMTEEEKEGAILFFDKGKCTSCHTGPALSTDDFRAIGLNDLVGNHIINSNPDDAAHLGRGSFTQNPEDMYKFKVPQLYNMNDSPFFGHGASFTTFEAIVRYKNDAIKQNARVPDNALDPDFVPLGLTDGEITKMVAFLRDGLYDPNLKRYQPDFVLSGNCFPNNDPISQVDLGCN